MKKEIAAFAAGCFWGPQLEFSKLDGVIKTKAGYMGGKDSQEVSYEEVCTGRTGHAETVEIEFDSEKVSYKELLSVFWKVHNPTERDRQGPDVGNQYRSVIFYFSEKQKKEAEESKKKEQKKYDKKIATEIIKAGKFYAAEEYHQDYLKKKGLESCHI